jgi:hypothetical protein
MRQKTRFWGEYGQWQGIRRWSLAVQQELSYIPVVTIYKDDLPTFFSKLSCYTFRNKTEDQKVTVERRYRASYRTWEEGAHKHLLLSEIFRFIANLVEQPIIAK